METAINKYVEGFDRFYDKIAIMYHKYKNKKIEDHKENLDKFSQDYDVVFVKIAELELNANQQLNTLDKCITKLNKGTKKIEQILPIFDDFRRLLNAKKLELFPLSTISEIVIKKNNLTLNNTARKVLTNKDFYSNLNTIPIGSKDSKDSNKSRGGKKRRTNNKKSIYKNKRITYKSIHGSFSNDNKNGEKNK
jgi:uncharacterized protein YgiM (DUF1202 family)